MMRRLILLALLATPAQAQIDYLAPWSAYVGGAAVAARCGIVLGGPEAAQWLENIGLLANHARKKMTDSGMTEAEINTAMDQRRAAITARAHEMTGQGCDTLIVTEQIRLHQTRGRGGLSAH
ncbi:MAG: hypothetical protein H7Z12_06225 [Rhodospirillaceae bacterium]|nr:hypothetical protein [Rhodospirillales bacterium]